MKLKRVLLTAMSAVILMSGCQKSEKHLGFPSLDVSRTTMSFEKTLSSDTLSFVATRAWTLKSESPWISFDPESGEPSDGKTVVTVTVLPNESYDRTSTLAVNIGFTEIEVTVNQLGKGSPEQKIFYSNDFDKEAATQTYGSKKSSWPYLDESDCWKNQKGTALNGMVYGYSGMSTRNNSNSNGPYSDYDGSGVNNLFFGTDSYLALKDLNIKGEKNIAISFGTEKYNNDDKTALFDPAEFLVYVSKDAKKWIPVPYTYLGTAAGRWNLGVASISLGESVEKLSFCIKTTVSNMYRLDDLRLELAESEGDPIDFNSSSAVEFEIKTEGGGGGGEGDDIIFSHDFMTGGIGQFTIRDIETDGLSAIWVNNSSYGMKATGFDSGTKINHATESWLISPVIDLSTTQTASIEFYHCGNYFTDIKSDVHLLVTEDSTIENWQELSIQAYPSSWTIISSGKIDLASYVGKKVKFAFKYTSTATKAGTWEITKLSVTKSAGQGGGGGGEDPTGSSIKITGLSTGLTWAAATDATYGDGFTGTHKDMTISVFKNKSTSNLVMPDSKYPNIKVYKNAILIISLTSGKSITGIKMTCSGTSSNPYAYDMEVVGGGTVVANASDYSLKWTGKMTPFQAVASGGQIRPENLEVFYE